jgi:pentose-5-phosphate-3-epimerase
MAGKRALVQTDRQRFYSARTLPAFTRQDVLDGNVVRLNPALITIIDGLVKKLPPETLQERVLVQVELLLRHGKIHTFHVDVNFEDYGGFGARRPDINTTIFTPDFLARLDECVQSSGAFLNLHLLTDRPQDHLREFEAVPLGAVCFQLDAVQEPTVLWALVHQIVEMGACASPVIETVGTENRPPLSVEVAFALLEPILPSVGMLTFQASGTATRSRHGEGRFDRVAPYIARARRAFDGTFQIQGGITTETIGEAVRLGAEFLVCGTQIFCSAQGHTPPGVVDHLLIEAASVLVNRF